MIAVAAAVLVIGGDDADKAAGDAQTVRFEKPTERGEDPFTRPADVRGGDRVDVGSGPFGGSGSDLVCDRELLIRSLRARPDRLEEWARVLDVEPNIRAVARYIRTLRPVTLTRDTRVTNHSFVDGRAVRLQSILQAGTAVLVDEKGVPVVRCRCGNPLLEPVYVKTAKCIGCPPNYTPPPPCEYVDFGRKYSGYDGDEYLRVYRRRDFTRLLLPAVSGSASGQDGGEERGHSRRPTRRRRSRRRPARPRTPTRSARRASART